MSKLFTKLTAEVDKISAKAEEGIHHARDTAIGDIHFAFDRTQFTNFGFAGLLNPNRRHDEPEEKRMDMIRAEINASHRFDSFADERSQNFVKWSVYCFPCRCLYFEAEIFPQGMSTAMITCMRCLRCWTVPARRFLS